MRPRDLLRLSERDDGSRAGAVMTRTGSVGTRRYARQRVAYAPACPPAPTPCLRAAAVPARRPTRGGPDRRLARSTRRRRRSPAPGGPAAWPASSRSSTPTRTASSTSPTPSSCSSPRCSPRRPPTRWSTRSRRRCSPATRTPSRSPAPTATSSRRSSSRPASSGRRRTRCSAWRQALVERFDGEVPGRMADLVTLPGVGRKTANVVLGNAFGVPGLTVDTHFGRLVRRFGWTDGGGPGQGRGRDRRAASRRRSGPTSATA